MLEKLFRRNAEERVVANLYAALVAHARAPDFFAHCGVPDSVDGRFDLIVLHAFLVMHRLKGQGREADAFAQRLFDFMFADMDHGLREMGVSDLSVGKKVKAMARAFYGRVVAYERGLATAGDEELVDALDRNLYGTVEPDEAGKRLMANYVRREVKSLAAQPVERIIAGTVTFGPPPGAEP